MDIGMCNGQVKGEDATMIEGISIVVVYVSDQDKARDFYVKTLGFEEREDHKYGQDLRWVEVAPARHAEFALALLKPGQLGQGHSGIAFLAEDTRATYRELKDKGVRFEGEPTKIEAWWETQFVDPDNNKFLIVDPLYHKRPVGSPDPIDSR
jgi:catechol 2,3-dioxygenase-like lactoylglutathione lyase family enzyme